jgi:hypothetical protein
VSRGKPGLAALAAAGFLVACPGDTARPESSATLAHLRATHARLHTRLEAAVARDAIANRAFKDPGQIVVAMRSDWVEELMVRVAAQYLDRVVLDLASVEARAGGSLEAGTFLGRLTVGHWRVEVTVESLHGVLSAGTPTLSFENQGLLQVNVPAKVRPTPGRVSIRFFWDSAGLANVVCKDFELTRDLDGSVVAQTHELAGAVRFSTEEGAVVAVPSFPDRRVALRMDLSTPSWAVVEAALRSQDRGGRCGLLMKPEEILDKLRALADRGIGVTLPERIFRTVRLPTRVEKSVEVGDQTVGVTVAIGRLTSSPELLWSSASVAVSSSEPSTPPPDGSATP